MIGVEVPANEVAKVLREIDRMKPQARRAVVNSLQKSTKAMARGARSRIRSKTGNLRKRIKVKVDTDKLEGTVKSTAPHTHLVEYGTKRHLLSKNKKVLKINGQLVKGDVYHPGSKPRPFMRPAFEEEAPNFVRNVRKELERS